MPAISLSAVFSAIELISNSIAELPIDVKTNKQNKTSVIKNHAIYRIFDNCIQTKYMFVKMLVNTWGEDEAFRYFDALAENILQFTSSGSGPVNALIQGEAAIGLGMTAQAVTAINDGANLKILFFDEGSPFSLYGFAMPEGKQDRKAVRDVFDFFYTTLVPEDKELFYPEQIYKEKTFEIENYPTNIIYGDMSGNTTEEKTRLLDKWEY